MVTLNPAYHRWLPPEGPNVGRETVAALLAADDVDAARIRALATRQHFADAAAALVDVVRPQGTIHDVTLIGSLFYPPIELCIPGRIAGHMGALPRNGSASKPELTLDDLRQMATHNGRERASRAKTALAILGQPLAPYGELSKRERAGLLLGLLVVEWRERSP